MNKCKKCDVQLENQRAHLGYTECLDCSEVEAYSAHTVYPHKTGGYTEWAEYGSTSLQSKHSV